MGPSWTCTDATGVGDRIPASLEVPWLSLRLDVVRGPKAWRSHRTQMTLAWFVAGQVSIISRELHMKAFKCESGRFAIILFCVLCGEVLDRVGQAQAASRLDISVSRTVHPLLIRNEHSPLMRMTLEQPAGEAVSLTSMTFQLAGENLAGDLESLTLFAAKDREEFEAATPIGGSLAPAASVTWRGSVKLAAGRQVFWLACTIKSTANLSHGVSASCLSVATTAGRFTPADTSVAVRQRIGVALRKHKDDGVHTYRIPALATTAKGTLLCVYDMRRRMGRDLQEDIDIGLSRSTDGGRSWEPARVIMDMGEYGGLPQEQNGCSDPGIIVDRQTGEIFCFAVWMNGKPGKHQWSGDGSEPGYEIGKSAQFLMVRSQDDGRTWSQPENLTRKLKQEAWWLFAPSPQQGIQLGRRHAGDAGAGRGRTRPRVLDGHDQPRSRRDLDGRQAGL